MYMYVCMYINKMPRVGGYLLTLSREPKQNQREHFYNLIYLKKTFGK